MTQMVLIKEWLAYHVWMSRPVCPKVRLVTALLVQRNTPEKKPEVEREFLNSNKSYGDLFR